MTLGASEVECSPVFQFSFHIFVAAFLLFSGFLLKKVSWAKQTTVPCSIR